MLPSRREVAHLAVGPPSCRGSHRHLIFRVGDAGHHHVGGYADRLLLAVVGEIEHVGRVGIVGDVVHEEGPDRRFRQRVGGEAMGQFVDGDVAQ